MQSVTPQGSFANKNFAGSIAGISASVSSLAPTDMKFAPSAKPSISKNSKNLAVFYPGVPIESIVPNPVYVNNPPADSRVLNNAIYENPHVNTTMSPDQNKNEKLITSVYVTNTNKDSSINNKNTEDSHYENQ